MGFHRVVVVLHVLFNAIGLPGNLLVMVTIASERRLHIMRHILLASLAFSDFLCLILVNSFSILSTAKERWLYGRTMCHLHPQFMKYFYLNTVIHLIAVSYDRYSAIAKSPLQYDGTITKFRMMCIGLIWLVPFAVFIGPVVGVWKYSYNPEVFLCKQETSLESIFASFAVAFVTATLYVVPFVVIIFLNWSVFKTARNVQRNVIAIPLGSIEGSEPNQLPETRTRQRERKAAVDVAIIIAVFLLCYLPGWTLSVFHVFGEEGPAAATWTARCLFAVSLLCNPIIYSIRKREFRTAMKNMLRQIGRVCGISSGADIFEMNDSAFGSSLQSEAFTARRGELQVTQLFDGRISSGADNVLDMNNSAFGASLHNESFSARPRELQATQPLDGSVWFGANNILVLNNSELEASLHKKSSTSRPGKLQLIQPVDKGISCGVDNILCMDSSALFASLHSKSSTAKPAWRGRISFGSDNILFMNNLAFGSSRLNENTLTGSTGRSGMYVPCLPTIEEVDEL